MADLRRSGCAPCHGAGRAAWRHIDSLLWEFVNDPGIRRRLRASRGFCREHALMALSVASKQGAGVGIAILYEDFLRHIRDQAVGAATRRGRGATRRSRGSSLRRASARCPTCESADATAANYLRILGEADEDSDPGRAARRASRGLCLPHLAMGLELAATDEAAERLLDVYLRGEEALRASLLEFVRKHDYRFRGEGMSEDERDAWVRAAYTVVGEPPLRKPPVR
jgi:hypothetical protein